MFKSKLQHAKQVLTDYHCTLTNVTEFERKLYINASNFILSLWPGLFESDNCFPNQTQLRTMWIDIPKPITRITLVGLSIVFNFLYENSQYGNSIIQHAATIGVDHFMESCIGEKHLAPMAMNNYIKITCKHENWIDKMIFLFRTQARTTQARTTQARSTQARTTQAVTLLQTPLVETSIEPVSKKSKLSDVDDVVVVEKPIPSHVGDIPGDFACIGCTGSNSVSDYPHPRYSCTVFPFKQFESNLDKCVLCYCFVCDIVASECTEWDHHCNADYSPKWKAFRTMFKQLKP